ncbi:Peptidase S9, prolyl oligopeptidase, catalytic domain protein [Niveomyces insectorum RCEF 264]|uniref:Dipeptidyl-peptidase V n=1 Tax=Niveomyces insectorum RCEF 264 TaxID=1081102 RepID=A0A167P662_9HYPO|nr:Peptidase S9, prolyl oligopeptidase, catalytic domain protein [Niveomyces insectorum RCEF 264]
MASSFARSPLERPPPRTLMDDLLELEVPDGLVLNRAADRVAYHTHTRWNNHPHGQHPTSSLWVADVGKAKSARRITDGEYHDHSPQWSLDGKCIFFLSNRRKKKKNSNNINKYSIYYIDVDLVLRGDTIDVRDDLFADLDDIIYSPRKLDVFEQYNKTRPPDFRQTMDSLSRDTDDRPADTLRELPDAKDYRSIANDDPSVRLGARLRKLGKGYAGVSEITINHLCYATTHINVMVPRTVREGYLVDVAWSDDGQQTVVVTWPSADRDSAERHGSTFWTEMAYNDDFAEKVFHVPGPIEPGSLAWVGPHVYFLSWRVAGDASSGLAVLKAVPGPGDHNDTNKNKEKTDNGDVLVHIQHGTVEKLVLVGENRTLLASENAILDYAAVITKTSQSSGGSDASSSVLVVVQNNMDHPSEVFSVDSSTGQMVQLSDHGGEFVAKQQQDSSFGMPNWIECRKISARGGGFRRGGRLPSFVRVDPVVPTTGAPYPTVILVHDGPYSRATNGFDRRSSEPDLVELLAPLLLRAGVAILQPNYRGGSGRGSQFAALGRAREGGVGRCDVDDVVALAHAAIEQNLADPAALFVMGWGYGGYLAYLAHLAALRSDLRDLRLGWQFRGAVCGGAIADWDTLAVTSSEGYRFANLSGSAPWTYGSDESTNAAPSPLRELAKTLQGVVSQRVNRMPPLLVFHGEADTLVPVSQAGSIRRAFASAPCPNKPTVMKYPGQGHFLRSKECIEDMLNRIVHFVVDRLGIQIDDLVIAQE